MLEESRILNYPYLLLRTAIIDLVDEIGADLLLDPDNSALIADLSVYERISRFRFILTDQGEQCHLSISFVQAASDLSRQGQKRMLNYLADALEQRLENSVTQEYRS